MPSSRKESGRLSPWMVLTCVILASTLLWFCWQAERRSHARHGDNKISQAASTVSRKQASRARTEDELLMASKMQWVPGTTSVRFGSPMVSHPSCLGAVHVVGAYGEERVLIRDICCKGAHGGDCFDLLVEAIDYGWAYHNKVREGNYIAGRFLTVNGYPIPIYESTHQEAPDKKSRSLLFAWDGVFYLVTETHKIGAQRISFWPHGTGKHNRLDTTVESVRGHDVAFAHELGCNLWFAVGSTPQNEIGVRNTFIAVENAIPTGLKAPIASDYSFIALGNGSLGANDETLICFGIGETKAELHDKIGAALSSDWHGAFESARTYWGTWMEGLREQWITVPVDLRVKGYMALQQIAMACYNPDHQGAFMGAGPGTWYRNFVRDTAWVIRALSKVKASLAAEMIDWVSKASTDPISNTNAWGIDGLDPCDANNTDNAATWLLAIGEYYRVTKDLARMTAHHDQLVSALEYAKINFVPAEGHIKALHPHDFADDGWAVLPSELIRFESMIDILWIAGLEGAQAVFADLGDAANADFCSTTGASLRANLDDYRLAGGRLAHSIRPDGTLQDAAWWFPSYLYDAWLLGNEQSWEWCSKSAVVVGIRNMPLEYGLAIGWAPDTPLRQESWGPFLGIIALLAAQHGDFEPASFLANSFPSGAFPEFWCYKGDESISYAPTHYSHAGSFPWSYASILELVYGLSQMK